ncbi:hypothetical protein IDM30_02880 [Acinetobacter seifertii]|nr:hypothetical protein [Acinetobacter seifertii]
MNEAPDNLPYILRNFLINYQSRRLDFMRNGNNNEYNAADINEINKLTDVANEVLSILDKFQISELEIAKKFILSVMMQF